MENLINLIIVLLGLTIVILNLVKKDKNHEDGVLTGVWIVLVMINLSRLITNFLI